MQLRADESAVVEKAVRLAIESVMNVLSAVNSARTYELQRLVADRDRQIQRLEGRVREAETELRLLLRPSSPSRVRSRVPEQQSGVEAESSTEQRECEVRVSLDLLTGPLTNPRDEPDQDLTSSSGDQSVSAPLCLGQGVRCAIEGHIRPRDEGRVQACSPTKTQVKQERLCPSPGRVKAEPLSPEHGPPHQDAVGDSPVVFLQRAVNETVSPKLHGVLGHSELWQSAPSQVEDAAPVVPHSAPVVPHAAPVVPHAAPVSHSVPWSCRSSVSRRDQSEDAMRRRRASWRAASRRYYARKMARLQSHGHSLQSHAHSSASGSQYPPVSGVPSGSHSEPWWYPVCELAPLQHQPPPSSSDITLLTESDLLTGSFNLN